MHRHRVAFEACLWLDSFMRLLGGSENCGKPASRGPTHPNQPGNSDRSHKGLEEIGHWDESQKEIEPNPDQEQARGCKDRRAPATQPLVSPVRHLVGGQQGLRVEDRRRSLRGAAPAPTP